MSAPASSVSAPAATCVFAGQLKVLLRAGLLEFWRRSLPEEGVFELLRRELADSGIGTWPEVKAAMLADWPPQQEGPLARLIEDYQLPPSQALLICLLGETEDAHLINLVVAALQAPEKSPRPSLHFCIALLAELFPEQPLSALDIAQSPLVEGGIVQLHGDGPLPLRSLSMAPIFWSLFLARPVVWPQCRELPAASEDFPQLESLAALLSPQQGSRSLLLRGHPQSGRSEFAAALAQRLGMRAVEVSPAIWENQPAIVQACRYGGWLPVLRPSLAPGEVWPFRGGSLHPGVVILGSDGAVEADNLLEVHLGLADQETRQQHWLQHTVDPELALQMGPALISQRQIRGIVEVGRGLAQAAQQPLSGEHIARARRQFAAEKLRLLAEPVDRQVGREALVVPALVASELDRLVLRARRRESLWQGLGATLKISRNAGVRALFIGESGTGKTLAASYIATQLAAPLYRVDLASVMNKYIGESEKNLGQLLDQAAASDVVLLFDEADSLIGSRSEGKETGERFANMLTNFLLTRIENHPGIVLLTSNSQERIDNAFGRRLDMVIEFPLPAYEERLELWRSHLGGRGPGEALCKALAAYCNLAGGQLRNAVITAAMLSGEEAISEWAVLEGVKAEYRKLGRELPQQIARREPAPDRGGDRV